MVVDALTSAAPAAEPAEDPVLGACLHVFETVSRRKPVRRRGVELLGILGLALVPLALGLIKGTVGTVIAVLGGLMGIVAYLASSKQPRENRTRISLFDRGIVCAVNEQSRTVLWNAVVDIATQRFPMPSGALSTAVVFEVVAEPPLLVVLGGKIADAEKVQALLDALERVWIPTWCRRARVQLENDRSVRVGKVELGRDHLLVAGRTVSWGQVQGFEAAESAELLRTTEGLEAVDDAEKPIPFPSTARRLAAVAKEPPSPPLLLGSGRPD
jgi:hypothetical protein